MSSAMLYGLAGIMIFVIGVHGMVSRAHLLRKALAMNVMGAGIFLFMVAFANRIPGGTPDPVPHAMVLTGIVVSISATGLILALIMHLYIKTGATDFEAILKTEKKEEEQ